MEKANTLKSKGFAPNWVNSFLPFGIIALVAMLVLPLPVALLDTFFVLNITLSLLILMVALHTQRPLDFSSFPNLLLIATVLRLGLNVASTRIVLKDGHTGPDAAGKVIEAFGEFYCVGKLCGWYICFHNFSHHKSGGYYQRCWSGLGGICKIYFGCLARKANGY